MQESSSSENEESSEDEEMALFMRRFKKFVKKNDYGKYKRDAPKRRTSKRACYECGEVGHFIADCPNKKKSKDKEEYKGKSTSKPYNKHKTHKKKYSGHAHIGEEWDSNSDSDSDEGGVATIAIRKQPQRRYLMSDDEDDSPKCFMAKGRKVKSQSPPLASDDDDCNDVDVGDNVFKGLSKNAMSRIKEMLDTIDMHEETLENSRGLAYP